GETADLEYARCEDLRLAEGRAEARRHDADHLPRLSVQLNRLADDAVASAEPGPPQLVADDAHGRTVWQIVFHREVAPGGRHHAERRKERGAVALTRELFRVAVARQREVVERADANRRKRA